MKKKCPFFKPVDSKAGYLSVTDSFTSLEEIMWMGMLLSYSFNLVHVHQSPFSFCRVPFHCRLIHEWFANFTKT